MNSRHLKILSLSSLSVLALVGCGQQLWKAICRGLIVITAIEELK